LKAVEIVRATRSPESAKIVAKYFQSTKDYKAVIEFCLLAGLAEEAMSYAQVYFVCKLMII
jgi:WD repeat-containing protein 19